jgi:hypothetical protein
MKELTKVWLGNNRSLIVIKSKNIQTLSILKQDFIQRYDIHGRVKDEYEEISFIKETVPRVIQAKDKRFMFKDEIGAMNSLDWRSFKSI